MLRQNIFFVLLLIICLAGVPRSYAHHAGHAPDPSRGLQDSGSISSGPLLNSPTASTMGKLYASACMTGRGRPSGSSTAEGREFS